MTIVVNFFRGVLRFLRDADILLLALCLVSSVYGVILIRSITGNVTPYRGEVNVQIGAMFIGIILFILFSYIDIDIIADKSKLLFVFSLALISTLLIWGVGEDDVGRGAWLRFFDIGIQPAEITKIPFIIIMARMIVTYKEQRTFNSFMSIVKIFLVFGIIFVFVLQISQDMGTALVYFGIIALMLFAGGMKLRWFAIGAALITAATPLIWDRILSEKQQNRILAPFVETIDPTRQNEL